MKTFDELCSIEYYEGGIRILDKKTNKSLISIVVHDGIEEEMYPDYETFHGYDLSMNTGVRSEKDIVVNGICGQFSDTYGVSVRFPTKGDSDD